MKTLTSIVAVNGSGAIGAGNRLPWRIRSDLRFFREQTIDQVVIMGRKTFDSLNQRGLPDRKNIVVTHDFRMISLPDNCRPAGSIREALLAAEDWKNQRQRVFVVGGASMYEQFSPYVDRYLVTLVSKAVPDADTFFVGDDLDNSTRWSVREIASGVADGVHDEADYLIRAYTRTDSVAAIRRSQVVDEALAQRQGNSLVQREWLMRATG